MPLSFTPNRIRMLSTANPSPYWDRIMLRVYLTSTEVVQTNDGLESREIILAMKVGDLGYCGAGGLIELSNQPPEGAANWEISIPDDDSARPFNIIFTAQNIRGLDDKSIARLIGHLGILSAEITAGALYHAPSKLLEAGAHIALGLAGFGLEHLISEIFADPPQCMGDVLHRAIPTSPASLKKLPFDPAEEISPGRVASLFKSSVVHAPARPGSGCGTPHTKLDYSIIREFEMPPSFGKSKKSKTTYVELDTLAIADVRGMHVDSAHSLAPSDWRVKISLQPTSTPWQDGIDLTINEILIDDHGKATTIVDTSFQEVQLQSLPIVRPGKDVFGINLIASLLTRFTITEQKHQTVALAAGQAEIAASQPNVHLHVSPTPADVTGVRLTAQDVHAAGQAVLDRALDDVLQAQASSAYVDMVYLFPETVTLPLPNGVVLSFWKRVTFQSGKIVNEGISIRYFRNRSALASKTDVWLARLTPVK